MRSVVVIPARYKSTRFPGKPLVPLLGKPMILWVAELSARAVGKSNVYIATDDQRIGTVVEDAGFNVVLTSDSALTGTDRLGEVAEKVVADIYINVQGDEPLVDPLDICKIRDAKIKNMTHVINGYSWVSTEEDPKNVNIPKVITDEDDNLIYMSRAPLPAYKEEANAPLRYKKQVCIYAFSASELQQYRNFGRKSYLEQCEDIEILRFLEFKTPIKMIETKPGTLAVDRQEDVVLVERALREKKYAAN